jgi:DNA-binding transcriptional regulator YdaS (Cro superfamily)
MTVYVQTLRRAAQIVGDDAALARALGVTPADLQLWLAGRAQPPMDVFLLAVDIVVRDSVKGSK